jgi:transposase
MERLNICLHISNEKFNPTDVLPIYYKRQEIEQTFDISKNCVEVPPPRIHNETTLRGHLLVSFIAIAAYQLADSPLTISKREILLCVNVSSSI